MKYILIILLASVTFAQSGKSVLTQAQKDSIGAMISDSLDSFSGTTDLTNYVDKTTRQVITGQKNFMGTVKFDVDTSMQIGTTEANTNPVFLDWTMPKNYNTYYSHANLFSVRPSGNDSVGDYTMAFRTWAFNGIMGHGMYWGYNQNYRLPSEPVFSWVAENPYRWLPQTEVYEWYWSWQDSAVGGTYSYRPVSQAIYYYRDSTTNEPLDSIPLVELALAQDKIVYLDQDRSYVSTMYLDGEGTSIWDIADTTYFFYRVNNSGWLYQAATNGNPVEIARVDNSNSVYMPNAVKFGQPFVPYLDTLDFRFGSNSLNNCGFGFFAGSSFGSLWWNPATDMFSISTRAGATDDPDDWQSLSIDAFRASFSLGGNLLIGTKNKANLDRGINLAYTDSIPSTVQSQVSIYASGTYANTSLKVKDGAGNVSKLTGIPNFGGMPSDSTGLSTGDLYFNSTTGAVHRKF